MKKNEFSEDSSKNYEIKDINEDLSNEDINSINKEPNNIMPSDLNLEKELETSKTNIIIEDNNNYLIPRKWDYLDKNKANLIEKRFRQIESEINKEEIDILKKKIDNCKINFLYEENFRPRECINKIGTISSLDFMIETSFSSFRSPKSKINIMFENKKILEKYIYKFRNVLGDGDCFYRGLIFSILENIVLTKNILFLKELFILFYEKINMKNPLIKEKHYLLEMEKLSISFTTNIFYILTNEMEKNYESAYPLLIKLFLFCPKFDYGIIYFTRYLFFDYILSNEDKQYSIEYKIELGCLLPESYVIDKGKTNDYLFENYFASQLMKPKTFAEKIIIYITPYVFNYDLNILIYDYGTSNPIEEKEFTNGKKQQNKINLLFRKAHYDIYYKKDYYEKYSDNLGILPNIKEDLEYLDKKEYMEPKRDNNPEEPNKKNITNNNDTKLIKNEKEESDNEKENNLKHENDIPKCLECRKEYKHKGNAFFLCNDCLINQFTLNLCDIFFSYLGVNKTFQNGLTELKNIFSKKKINISIQNDVPLFDAINESGYKFDDLFSETKKIFCLYCGPKYEVIKYFFKLPCGCRFCSQECMSGFIEYLNKFNQKKITKERYERLPVNYCNCGYKYDLKYFVTVFNDLQKLGLIDYQKVFMDSLKIFIQWRCIDCRSIFTNSDIFYIIEFNDKNLDKIISKEINNCHLICHNCLKEVHKNNYICKFCNSEHHVTSHKRIHSPEDIGKNDGCVIL